MLFPQMNNMDEYEAGCRVLGRCMYCFSEEQFVIRFKCNRTVCERCYISRMKSSSKVIQWYIFPQEFKTATHWAWNFKLHETAREAFFTKKTEMMAKYEEDLANYNAEIEVREVLAINQLIFFCCSVVLLFFSVQVSV